MTSFSLAVSRFIGGGLRGMRAIGSWLLRPLRNGARSLIKAPPFTSGRGPMANPTRSRKR